MQDHRPWVKGFEHELATYDQAVSGACTRKRHAESLEELRESVAEIRRCKRRRSAWLRSKEVEWWDDKARQVQDKADQGDAFGVFFHFYQERKISPKRKFLGRMSRGTSGGHSARISRPKTSVRALQILEKQAFRRGYP